MLQMLVPLRVVRQRFKFGDEVEDVLRAVADVFMNAFRRIEHEILRQIAGDQFALPGNFATVRRLQAGEDFQERRFAAAVAPDESDAVALLNAKSRSEEHTSELQS